jgi:putative spermidine/putrescine transport system permease protein
MKKWPVVPTPYLLMAPALPVFVCFLLIPLAATVLLSFYSWDQYKGIVETITAKNWIEIASDGYFAEILWRTLRIAGAVTLLCLLFGVPEAYILSKMRPLWRGIFLLVVLGPLLISVVARTLGWALLLGSTGILNQAMVRWGLINTPLPFMFTELGVIVALTHVLMPYMILSVWASLQRLDPQVENAALSLGAAQATVLARVVLPQIVPGILSGAVVVFAMAASAFATPAIIGGRRLKVASTLAYDEFLNTLNWPLGATVAVILLVTLLVIIFTANRFIERRYIEILK